ncbi:MAG TPA: hypothetical protein VGV37_02515 [Aliidongia sp.]|uniref:hypothetical protein n=1 Tax=Aliidongia sp. TaxID=1914230 RepID=UPI002DDCDB4B|nr:hypothetical protein [Aliidongia sp.]HEV2673384.1 hypothetical protein [Aliidongia sp.]
MNIRSLMGSTALRFGGAMMAPDEAAAGGTPVVTAPGATAAVSPPPPPAADPNAVRTPIAFAETLPEKIRGEAAFKDIKDLDTLANGYLHAQRMLGKVAADPNSVVALPGADDADGLNALYTRLGRPETADKYALAKPAAGDYSDADKAFQAKILPTLHEAGLTQRQLDKILPAWNDMQAASVAAQTEAHNAKNAAGEAALKTEFGAAYDEKLGLAKQALTHFGNEKLAAELVESGLGNHPEVIKIFAKLGKGLVEDGVVGRATGGGGLNSPAEAQQQINALQADKEFARIYTDKRAIGHADAVAKMQALYQQAHPEA